MMRLPCLLTASFSLLAPAITDGQEIAFLIPVPIVYETGERLEHVTDLPPLGRGKLGGGIPEGVAIGFAYRFVTVLWCDFWTWHGRHVLYHGDKYWELTNRQFIDLLGENGFESLGKPFSYHVPSGLAVVLCLGLVILLWKQVLPSRAVRARRLLKDAAYSRAVQVYEQKLREGGVATAASEDAAFRAALSDLRGWGTEEQLALVLDVLNRERSTQRNDVCLLLLAQAEELERSGALEAACRVYEDVIALSQGTDGTTFPMRRLQELREELLRSR